jgi:hypothetical protein
MLLTDLIFVRNVIVFVVVINMMVVSAVLVRFEELIVLWDYIAVFVYL